MSSNRSLVDFVTAASVIGLLMMVLIPLPTWLLSAFLVLNLALSIAVLLMTTYIDDILSFSVFPTLLLGLTLFRLALAICSTKLILLQGDAGSVIHAFGEVVVKGNAVVGFIVFLILMIVQFIVITKGSERVSEVAARFTLDAMPGKQMGVDAELNAGLINEQQARARRDVIEREADFYGAMDGASKFIRGDAIAAMIVVVVNIVGGMAVGFMQGKMHWIDIVRTYTILTIGDGLVHQVPALIVSTATGILVTRSASKTTLGVQLIQQFSANTKALTITGGILFSLAGIGLLTGLPVFPFLTIGLLMVFMARFAAQFVQKEAKKEETKAAAEKKAEAVKGPEDVMPLLHSEVLEVELGFGLLFLVDGTRGGDLLDRVATIRRQCAKDLGIVVPPIRIRDNGSLPNNSYSVKIRGLQVANAELMPKYFLAMSNGLESAPVNGIPTQEPTFGLPAMWIKEDQRRHAEVNGYTVVDNPSIVATHLTEIIKAHAHELLGRQETQNLITDMKSRGYTAICDELIPGLLPLGTVQKSLQNLLRERVSIRNLLVILESLAETATFSKDTDVLTEYARAALSRQITRQYADKSGSLWCLTFAPEVEQYIHNSIQRGERSVRLVLEPVYAESLTKAIADQMGRTSVATGQPVLLTSSPIRPYVQRFLDGRIASLAVLSYNEVAPEARVNSLGVVEDPIKDMSQRVA